MSLLRRRGYASVPGSAQSSLGDGAISSNRAGQGRARLRHSVNRDRGIIGCASRKSVCASLSATGGAPRHGDARRLCAVPGLRSRGRPLRLDECLLRWSEVNWDARPIVKIGTGSKLVTTPITSEVRAILWPLLGHDPQFLFTNIARRILKGRGLVKGRRLSDQPSGREDGGPCGPRPASGTPASMTSGTR